MEQPEKSEPQLSLHNFFPYQLARFSEDVSRAIALLYGGRFNLTRNQWRVLAALGEQAGLTAKAISEYSTLDKTEVSRATAKLLKEQLILRREDSKDRRNLRHYLTRRGEAVYQEIVPLALARERHILSALSEEEQLELDRLISRVHQKALELHQWG